MSGEESEGIILSTEENMTEHVTPTDRASRNMDAIAVGVETSLGLFLTYRKIVTGRTIEVARQLGMGEKDIQRWVTRQAMLDSKKNKVIQRMLVYGVKE